MLNRQTRYCIVALAATTVLLGGCTGLRPGYEMPTVTVNSLRALPSENTLPNFEVGLRVLNPNPEALSLRGVSFSISLDGHDLIKGVGNQLPVIEAYGADDITLTASANVLAGIRFISSLLRDQSRESFNYELKAKLDVGALRPAIRITDSGQISLQGANLN